MIKDNIHNIPGNIRCLKRQASIPPDHCLVRLKKTNPLDLICWSCERGQEIVKENKFKKPNSKDICIECGKFITHSKSKGLCPTCRDRNRKRLKAKAKKAEMTEVI